MSAASSFKRAREECCICSDPPGHTALTPCGHKSFCAGCVEKMCKEEGEHDNLTLFKYPLCRANVYAFEAC